MMKWINDYNIVSWFTFSCFSPVSVIDVSTLPDQEREMLKPVLM
jgi:hypothetical protein